MNLSVKHLRAFTELAAERNFTRAAAKCHLSQPAFSTLIRNLEDQSGAQLFNRSTRSVELTAEGRVFAARIAPLLGDFEHAFADLRQHVDERRGRLTVAALPALAAGPLPEVIASFMAGNPGIEVVLRDVTSDTCLELVRDRRADFALTSVLSPGPELRSDRLMSDTFHLVCRNDHPLAQHTQLTMSDVLKVPQIRFDRTTSVRQHLDAAFYPHRAITAMEVFNLATAAGLVAAGIAVTLVPTQALFHFQKPTLVAIPVKLPLKDRAICLIRRIDGSGSPASAAFMEILKRTWTRRPAARRTSRRAA
jgi:LysR family carnitine catabolism transcriptional activator